MTPAMAANPTQMSQLDLLLGSDQNPFETLISHLMSSSNDQRSAAESLFNLCKQVRPDGLLLKLTQVLSSSPVPELRAMSAVLLRRNITAENNNNSSSPCLFTSLPEAAQNSIKNSLLLCLRREDVKSIVRKINDAIAELAAEILPVDGWNELLPFLFQCVTARNQPNLQESALLIFAQLADSIGESLIPHLTTLHTLFLNCLGGSNSADVRIAALTASVSFIQGLPSNNERAIFQDLLPLMMQTMTEALNANQEATAQEALELLIELAGSEPRFFRRQIEEVVGAMLQIAEAGERLEEGTRNLAVEFVITLAEARERAPGMMRKLPQFVRRLFMVLMGMLLDIEDDPAWHGADNEDFEDAGETSVYGFGQECLDRLSISLGGNTVLPVASEVFPMFFGAPEWPKRHATLIALAQIAEGCSKVMIKNLDQVVSMILNSFQDPHSRVRWAAINAIGQLSTDLGPELQKKYHQSVLPALARAMDDFQNPRVQAHAASAVLNFAEDCTPDILFPYLDGIVSKLLVLLQNGKQMVQEGALTALASVADSSQEQFQKYYDAVMPYLKAILVNANDKSNRMLRAKAMECISLVGMAVGKEKFRDDAKQVMEVLMTLQGSQMEADDPTTGYMLQAWTRLCKCLGQDFLPYMNVVMPPLLHSAKLKPDIVVTSAEDATDDEDDDSVETIPIGDQKVRIKTSVLEEKATACNMLCCYADELKEGFFPWIDQVAPILVPLLGFYFHEEVRKAAVSAMPELLRSAKLAVEKGQSQGRDESYLKQLSCYIIPALVEALHKEPEVEICDSMLDSLNECMQVSGSLLDKSIVRSIMNGIKQVITASSARKQERAERTKAEDFDEEERELLKEENELEEDIFDKVGDCLGTLMKTFRSSFLPLFDEVSPYITLMLGKDKTSEERRIAICIIDDVIEHCGEAAHKYYLTYVPFLLSGCNDQVPDVRQAAVYGIGICAEFGGSQFKPFVGEALSRLKVVIGDPSALHSDNVMAYDNAVSALGKICQFHRDSIDAAQVVPAWLNCLPIKSDLIEAKVVHDLLCSMVERSDKELLGLNNQYLPKILLVFAEVICAGNDLATAQTINRMINLVRQIQQVLPPATLASTWSSLAPQQQIALQSILST